MMSVDNRKAPRKELRIQALLTMDGAEPVSLHTVDIAKYGMGLAGIPQQLAAGQQGLVAFGLFLNGQLHNVGVRVRVAYCIPDGGNFRAGLQFLNLDSAGAVLIAQYVGD
jgi:hypothetical protein